MRDQDLYCAHCGSVNHRSYDCSKQAETFVPTPEFLASLRPKHPERKPIVSEVAAPAPEPERPDRKLDPPRWPGGPPVCALENLPAFETREELVAWRDRNCPGIVPKRTWRCGHCGMWHAASEPGGPPRGFVPYLSGETRRTMKEWRREEPHVELPKRAEPERPVELPRAPKGRAAGDLF